MPFDFVPTGRAPQVVGFDQLTEIGRGGSSTVYAARQVQLGRRVALKVLHVPMGDDASRRRFERECAVLGALGDVPGIVAVYDAAFTADGRGCIVMRLMRESLAETLRRDGPLDAEGVRDVGVAAATALGHAHDRGVVHRDVKPANLLVSEFGDVALADFDIATVATLASSTTTSDAMSPPHAAPERLSGTGDDGPAGDLWSLGSTLHTLLTGAPPFGTATTEGGMAGLVARVLHDDVPAVGRPDVPPELESVLARALAKDPAQRWPDAAAMRDALAAVPFVDPGEAAAAAAAVVVPRARDWSRVVTATIVLVVVAVAVVATVLLAFG